MIDYIFGGIVDIHNSPPSFKLKQYDNNSHKLHMTIIDKDNPYGNTVNLDGHSVRAYFKLPDGSDEYVDCELIKPKSGKITVPFPSSVTQQVGIVKCEIRISDGNNLISLNVFTFEIVESIYNSSAIESTEKYSALDRALIEVQNVRNEVNALVALADNGEIPAGTLESEVVDARSGFSTLGAALRACVKGMNVYLNADRFRTLFGDSNYENGNFDNVGNNKIYPIGLSNGGELGNSPDVNINGTMVTFGRGDSRGNGDMQMIFTVAGSVWYRTCWNGWTEWKRQTRFDEFSGLAARVDSIEKPWQGLKVSVLGDSISTYPNHIPSGNACYYNTGNHPSVSSVNSMWWKQLCDLTGATPLVIEAWSGSCCAEYNSAANSGNSAATAAVDNSRCKNLHTGSGSGVVNPDIIIVALGCNDYFYNVPLGSWDGHAALNSTDTKTWRGAYANMLIKIHEQYPDALVLCFSPWFCVRGWNGHNIPSATVNINGNGSTYQDYEDAMREICELMGYVYIDVNNFGFTRQNYGLYFADDINAQTNAVTHPNATGQEVLGQSIAAEVISKAKGYVNWLRR